MSRSRKKSPVFSDPMDHARLKRFAARSFRRNVGKSLADVGDGKSYRKYWESYVIYDYRSRWTWEQARRHAERHLGRPLTPDEERERREHWEKICRRK